MFSYPKNAYIHEKIIKQSCEKNEIGLFINDVSIHHKIQYEINKSCCFLKSLDQFVQMSKIERIWLFELEKLVLDKNKNAVHFHLQIQE